MVSQLVLLLALSAEPTAATVLVRRTAVTPAEAGALTKQVATRLASADTLDFAESQRRLSLFGLSDATTCGGKGECHAEVGRQLGVKWLVLVSVSQIAQDQSLALELFEVATEKVHERESLLLPRKGEVPAAMLDSFAALVTKHVQAAEKDAPTQTTLTPSGNTGAPGPLTPTVPVPKSRAASVVLGVGAVAAIGAGVGLLIAGLNARAQVQQGAVGEDGRVRSELTGSQAAKLNDTASVEFGIAGGAAAVGLALGVGAVFAW